MNENAFSYTYSAACNQEILNIRKKYLPREETKLEELKRLDSLVRNSGVTESLCAGIGGCLVLFHLIFRVYFHCPVLKLERTNKIDVDNATTWLYNKDVAITTSFSEGIIC